MAKIVLVCIRAPSPPQLELTRQRLSRFLETLRPDNLAGVRAVIADDGSGLFLGIFNPVVNAVREGSAYAGWLANSHERWWQPRSPVPHGSFALFRSDAEQVELLADYAATRTIWIARNEHVFVASTSQRAIPWFLGGFEPNREAMAWMLASGSLGPGHSWDQRAHPLGPGGSARLDRKSWNLELDNPPVTFCIDPVPDEVHRSRLRAALNRTCGDLGLDRSKWAFPLSGGNDSRAILLRMQHREGLKCITWGLREAVNRPGSDAVIARRVADFLGLSHQYFETDVTEQPADRMLERFLVAGEGRIDHVSGYMDGFELWRSLNVRGTVGVIRGEHGFGSKPVSTADEARLRVGMALWSDYRNVPAPTHLKLDWLGEQRLPHAMEQQPRESASDWRDRLFHAFRIPSVHAALNELKSPYVEIASPLLVRDILELARSHPEHLRTGKRMFRDLAAEVDIPVDYAVDRAIGDADDVLGHPSMTELLLDELSSADARETLSPHFASFVSRRLCEQTRLRRASPRYTALKRAFKSILPNQVSVALKRLPDRRTLSGRRLALRTYFISKMAQRLRKDARAAG
jgi:hypothetical protein